MKMAFNLKQFMWENKEGAIIGGIIGFVVGKFALPYFGFEMSVFQQQGIIDSVITAAQGTVEFAKTKAIWAFTVLGAIIGVLVDTQLKEGWLQRLLK